MARKPADGGDARVDQPGALGGPHTGDQQQVVVLADLDRALGTAEACPYRLVLPGDRLTAGQVVVEQPLQRVAAWTVHRKQLVDPVAGGGAVAEHQLNLGRDRHSCAGQRVGVGGELKQCLDLDRPSELRVPQAVALAVEYQEVRETGEPAVEHGRLVDHRRPSFDCPQGGLGRGRESLHGVGGPPDDRDGVSRDQLAQLVEVPLLVLAAEFGRAGEQFVVRRDGWPPAEPGVERAQQRVLAAGRGCEVGGAVDHSIVGDEHVPNCRPVGRHRFRREGQPGVLPISSTPAPFQRNLTTLSSPGVPLEYTSATVSPVVADCSMPLNP